MPYYRRPEHPGGTFFFTVVTHHRAPVLCDELARKTLHHAVSQCLDKHPFQLDAVVLLPDHFHPLITLPAGDSDYSTRMASIKANFTRDWLAGGGREFFQSTSRRRRGFRGVWQKRYWDHLIRDRDDLARHLDYIHYNPVKHGLVTCPHLWPWSTFSKWVAKGRYPADWMCVCGGRKVEPPTFDGFNDDELE